MSVGSFSQTAADSRPTLGDADYPLIPYRYSTDDSPIHCRHTNDDIKTDCRSICRPISTDRQTPLGCYIDRLSTEISADTVIDSPRKIHDPINLLWESLLSRLECLAICRDKMYAAFMITIERTLGVGLDGKWTWDCHSNVLLFWKTATSGIYQMW